MVSDRLQEQIFGVVMAFARIGKPEYEGRPQWPASREGDEATMIFDRVCEVRHIPDSERQTCILCKPAAFVMLSVPLYLIDYIMYL